MTQHTYMTVYYMTIYKDETSSIILSSTIVKSQHSFPCDKCHGPSNSSAAIHMLYKTFGHVRYICKDCHTALSLLPDDDYYKKLLDEFKEKMDYANPKR